MAQKSCVVIPTIKVGNQEVESRLFKDLLQLTGSRESAKQIWSLAQVEQFTDQFALKRDSNGEITLQSLEKVLDITQLLDGKSFLQQQKKEVGAVDNEGNSIKHESVDGIIADVLTFNDQHKDMVASISNQNGGYYIDVDYKDTSNMDTPAQLQFQSALNNRLRGIMNQLGFEVDYANLPQGVGGMFNPLNGSYTADKLLTVIQIAEGSLGEQVFPEEFSHFAIEGLLKTPLVQRLLGQLEKIGTIQAVLGQDYDTYNSLYSGDLFKLQKEAAGKLLQQQITKQEVSVAPSLLQRVWSQIKRLISPLTPTTVAEQIDAANKEAANLASQILNEDILSVFDGVQVSNGDTLYNATSQINKLEQLAEKALELASKRLNLIKARNKSGSYNHDELNSVKKLQEQIEKKRYAKSISLFLKDATSQIEGLRDRLDTIQGTDVRDDSNLQKIRKVSGILRNIKEFSDGYGPIIAEMTTVDTKQKRGELDLTEADAIDISRAATEVGRVLANINDDYKSLRFNVVFNFLKTFWGEDKIQDVGKNKGRRVTLEMILEMADKDISFVDRWISSLSDASDPLLSVIDKAVKVSQLNRDSVLEDVLIDLRASHKSLVQAGYTSDFMYERDSNGRTTGYIISDIDFEKFNAARQAVINEAKQQGKTYYELQGILDKWDRQNTETKVVDMESNRQEVLPKSSIYYKDTLSKLAPAQREYYDTTLQVKSIMDSLLPQRYTNTYLAPQIRNNTIEAIADNITSPKEAARIVVQTLKDDFLRRSDDTDFGDTSEDVKNRLLDFAGKPIQSLPIHYTNKLEDPSRISTDFTSSIMAYSGMAINYNEMSKVVDVLELARELVKDRQVQATSGQSKLQETFKIASKVFTKSQTTKGDLTNIGHRIDDYYSANIYGKNKADEGTFELLGSEVDMAKTVDNLKSYSGVLGLGLNFFSAVSNISMGKLQIFIDSWSGEYFNVKNSAVSKKNYWALMPEFMGELNSTKKSNKLSLLGEKFDATEEFYSNLRHSGYYHSPLARIWGDTNAFILNNLGEHYLHNRTMLSLLDAYRVKDRSGKEMSLFDAYEVEKIDVDGQNLGGRLKLKEGITNLDGSAISEQNLLDLKLKIGKVNQALNGGFNQTDKGAIHKYALGRLAMQFRQWMPAHYNRRLAGTYYDARLDQWREGYYRTVGRFALNTIKDLYRMQFEVGANWSQLSEHEKANLKRGSTEILAYIGLAALLAMLGPASEKKGQWGERLLIYQLKRLQLEAGASIPFAPDFLGEVFTILQSPAAAITTIGNMTELLKVWNIFNEIEGGRYQGMSEYEVNAIKLIPFIGQYRKITDFGEEDYLFNIFN